ncbi:GNAT family N-acetyltransferase [Bailinhaonella thermotolerans]|uniref:N-acetyltransferase n=1 Tax=Bailinhaonella thermotolerans TaxID=1070861 RepID=A0A3A4AEU3_9ACTN|nr:GNAT family protein [Bailinhaonella thermotolerans]RJL24173.1 N-acetyltransferase [Bailinhaonella thermotolerans]
MFALKLTEDAELRPLEPWQAREFADYIDKHRSYLGAWLPWGTMITNEDEARAFLQSYADKQARDEGRIYGIWVDGELAGGTLFRVFDTRLGHCEVGVWLAPDASGRGLVTRAVRHMIDWAFAVRGLHRVEWRTIPSNERSIAAARRLGMTREGVLRRSYPLNGVLHDTEIWALLSTDDPAPAL